jgi:regulator of PEP synthase PpsR (kinase-PPPase family)
VLDVPPPAELHDIDENRVFALTIAPRILLEIRRSRMQYLGMGAESGYTDIQQIQRELAWARDLFHRHEGWTVLDVSNRAIEETATNIVRHYTERFGLETI